MTNIWKQSIYDNIQQHFWQPKSFWSLQQHFWWHFSSFRWHSAAFLAAMEFPMTSTVFLDNIQQCFRWHFSSFWWHSVVFSASIEFSATSQVFSPSIEFSATSQVFLVTFQQLPVTLSSVFGQPRVFSNISVAFDDFQQCFWTAKSFRRHVNNLSSVSDELLRVFND